MFQRLLRVFYVVEFLIALIAVFTVWSEVGGQVHLDYMPWYWKGGIGFAAAGATVLLTRDLVLDGAPARRRRIGWVLLLVLLAVCAGGVTYYTHLNEPQDQDEEDPGAITPTARHASHRIGCNRTFDPAIQYGFYVPPGAQGFRQG